MPDVRNAAILGTGLIGTSIALGLSDAGWDVVGWDPDPTHAAAGKERGAFSRTAGTMAEAVGDAGLIVLAAPGSVIPNLLGALRAEELAPDAVVTDVASVKASVMTAASHLRTFIGGHPMAGREMSGPEPATGALFKGAAWVLVANNASTTRARGVVESMVETLGAFPIYVSADEHDAAVARISHLPHALAAALMASASDTPSAINLAAGSFRDLTRVALSEPDAWTDILRTNRSAVADSIDDLVERLASFKELLLHDDPGVLIERLARAREARQRLSPPVALVRVALSDKPGELGKVGSALQASQVDIRDLQLRHQEHGGGGILSLSVRIGEADVLTDALADAGLEVLI